MRLALALALGLALGACGAEAADATPDPTPSTPTAESAQPPDEAQRTLRDDSVRPRPDEASLAAAATLPAAPDTGCAFAPPTRVWSSAGWVDVAWTGRAFVVAGTAGAPPAGEEAFVVSVTPGAAARTLRRVALEHPLSDERRRAAPALAVEGSRGAVALADSDRALLVSTFDLEGDAALDLHAVAQGASARFAPAIAARPGGWAVAYTDETGTPMRVRGVLLDRDGAPSGEPHDMTPAGGGGAAPTFVDGARPPRLVFLDPRAAMSVALAVDVGPDGFGVTEVARPVSLVAEPPETTAARIGAVDWLGYTGVGSVATSAVGLVRLEGTTPPSALVAGTGYGTLHVDSAPFGAGALFVADAPRESPPGSPREVHVRSVGADGQASEPTVVRGSDESAARARVAVADSGTVGVAFVADGATFLAVGRCAVP